MFTHFSTAIIRVTAMTLACWENVMCHVVHLSLAIHFYLVNLKLHQKILKELVFLMCRTMYLLGYIPKDDRLYLGDKELNVISYSLLLSVLEYQTAVMRRDFSTADKVLPTIPKEQRTRVALFLEKQVSLS